MPQIRNFIRAASMAAWLYDNLVKGVVRVLDMLFVLVLGHGISPFL